MRWYLSENSLSVKKQKKDCGMNYRINVGRKRFIWQGRKNSLRTMNHFAHVNWLECPCDKHTYNMHFCELIILGYL